MLMKPTSMEEMRQISAETKEIPAEENREISSAENGENPGEEVEGAGAVATEHGEIF